MRILEEFWYGNIEPTEYDTSSCKEYKKLLELICRNEEKLKLTMTDEQKELFEKYTDCVVCFVHEYDRELPDRRIRDYDNIEQKQILDVISSFVLKDDSGMCCDTYNSTALADEDKTRIFIMSRDRFCTWLAEQSAN